MAGVWDWRPRALWTSLLVFSAFTTSATQRWGRRPFSTTIAIIFGAGLIDSRRGGRRPSREKQQVLRMSCERYWTMTALPPPPPPPPPLPPHCASLLPSFAEPALRSRTIG
eukprot:scaffold97_cov261-Pinguiococcus_pyrenoidosus.AAC.2